MAKTRLQSSTAVLRRMSAIFSVLLIVFLPLAPSLEAYADCQPPDFGSGVHQPVGSDAGMYSYNCGTGLWESDHFTYDPNTGAYAPKDPTVYTYNSASGAYDDTVWVFSPASGHYIAITKSTASPPAGAAIVGGPTVSGNNISGTGAGSNNAINNNGGAGGNSINNTGANSNNGINNTGNNNFNGNNGVTLGVNNGVTGQALSGNALVQGNTIAGGANSGDASDVANVVSMLQSSSNALGGDMVTFVANIDGDVNGDLLLDPSALSSIQPASGNNNTTFNNSVDASINNTINLNANSGNAGVDSNTKAGDATSGSAKVIANVVNVINSAVASGKSFMGTININGNLNGDILLPPDFIDQLIAANVPTVNIVADTGPMSNNTINNDHNNSTNVTNTNDLGVTNNVKANAASGTANVSGNTNAGSATSGNARTNITAFNLTGSNVIGSNAILVFVNVTGKWVGLIVNAPPGATAAALGGGITNTGANSNNNVNSNSSNNTNLNNNVKHRINNDINTSAKSGDASVTNNTEGGNARSGDADNAVNLLNVENSTLSLSNWFGILFINVFGTWNGSFGVNTSAGDPVFATTAGSGGGATGPFAAFVPNAGAAASNDGVFNFAAYLPGSGAFGDSTGSNSQASISGTTKPKSGGSGGPAAQAADHVNIPLMALSGTIFVAYLFMDRRSDIEGFFSRRQNYLSPTFKFLSRH